MSDLAINNLGNILDKQENELGNEESIIKMNPKITVVGVGGGGGNMIAHMINTHDLDVSYVAINTDAQALKNLSSNEKINVLQIGGKLTQGLGAGMKPEVGKESALENAGELQKLLDGSDIVFIASGLGGGTGTGASPVVAQIAKGVGALAVAVVTEPFLFEGKKRIKLAEEGLRSLKIASDSIIVIPNNKLLKVINKNMGLKESFKMVDEVLSQAVTGTSSIILSNGNNDINLDFADLQTIMSHRGTALMGVGSFTGDDAATEAINQAINSPLLNDTSIDGAMGVLVHFETHPDYPMLELGEAMVIAENTADENADVIFGTSTNKDLDLNTVNVTLIATGFERNLNTEFASNEEKFFSLPEYLRETF